MSGCFITSLSMLADLTPPEVNAMMTQGSGYQNGNMVISEKAAALLGLTYRGRVPAGSPASYPTSVCIAETNKYAPNVPQHFFTWLGKKNDAGKWMIWDSLDGKEKENTYPLVSFRLFDPKVNTVVEVFPNEEVKSAFEYLRAEGIYTEFTKPGQPVDTNKLALILERVLKHS
jgi:hypothetical protein